MHCWINAVNHYRKELQQQSPSLDLKASAWLAGFPVNNAEIIIRRKGSAPANNGLTNEQPVDDFVYENAMLLEKYYSDSDRHDLIQDFVGPNIDAGFRVSHLASPRKLVMTLDLALLVATGDRTKPHHFKYDGFVYRYDGRVSLKGVLGGAPYPVFWIDMQAEEPEVIAEEKVTSAPRAEAKDLEQFAEAFIVKNSRLIDRPYIISNTETVFNKMPDSHSSRQRDLAMYYQNQKAILQEEITAAIKTDFDDDINISHPGEDALKNFELSIHPRDN